MALIDIINQIRQGVRPKDAVSGVSKITQSAVPEESIQSMVGKIRQGERPKDVFGAFDPFRKATQELQENVIAPAVRRGAEFTKDVVLEPITKFVSPQLEKLGVSAGIAAGIGFIGDIIATPGGKAKGGKNLKKLQGLPVFQGFKDYTTKVLNSLSGKTQVGRQFIEDLSTSAGTKQAERDATLEILKEIKGDKIPVQEFADKMATRFLPLEATNNPPRLIGSFEDAVLQDDLRGPVARYFERSYDSPIPVKPAGLHLDTPNHFAHTRIEEMAPGYMPGKGKVERTIEVQSDLFSKGRLEREGLQSKEILERGTEATGETRDFILSEAGKRNEQIQQLQPYSQNWRPRILREDIKDAAKRGVNTKLYPTGETAMKVEGLGENSAWTDISAFRAGDEAVIAGIDDALAPRDLKIGQTIARVDNNFGTFDPDDAWIITDVLGDGKFKAVPKERLDNIAESILERNKKLKVPFDESNKFLEAVEKKVGLPRNKIGGGELKNAGYSQKDIDKFYDILFKSSDVVKKQSQEHVKRVPLDELIKDESVSRWAEQFDISGKIDTSNPIFGIYEKQIPAHLKQIKGEVKRITDPQGVEWWEVPITKQDAKDPIQVFGGALPLGAAPFIQNENNR